FLFFFSSRRRQTRCYRHWSSDVCSSDLIHVFAHGAEDFVYAAQLLADLRNFPAHESQFVPASAETGNLRRRRVVLPRRNTVQLRSVERRVGKECRDGGSQNLDQKKKEDI